MTLTRRELAKLAGIAAAIGITDKTMAQSDSRSEIDSPGPDNTEVRLFGDGIGLAPTEYTQLLNSLCQEADIEEDNYLLGGEVEKFEQYCANLLGKEMAVFLPSGTLANQLALRQLAGSRRRVIVPGLSHVYNDTGDASQNLSSLNLIPLAGDRADFTLEEVQAILDRTASGRVTAEVGAILVENPVRRLSGEMVDWNETRRITEFARENDIGTHLDGARLFIASAYTGISPAEYAEPFDTVYFSLWKYFNSNIGAILAGPRSRLENMYHTRRMFGGNLFMGWPSALVARFYMEGFTERFQNAINVSETFYRAIESVPGLEITRIPNGTNVARLRISGTDISAFRNRLAAENIRVGNPNAEGLISLGVNETWNRISGERLAEAFVRALG
ncbi:MAG: hypothetical protein CMP91_04700 [Gammaproteobacteria bacterium]|nr:hypothetical protein [Gammaproteobacteria bacterium]|tara:strand:- start:419472 stop:420638 length:1167 start_codon:yes stop_codon:yes gene_type:complete